MQMSPSQRGAEDSKRLKARSARRGLSPGPGAYSPQQIGSTSRELSGHYAFRSSVERTVSNLLKESGDPGAYEPQVYLSLMRQATMSWNKTASGAQTATRPQRLTHR